MTARFTVFGQLAGKGESIHIYFDGDGRVSADANAALAHVEFLLDEDNDPVGHVLRGKEFFEHELLYFGNFADSTENRASLSCFGGRLVLCLRREKDGRDDHFVVGRAEMKLWLLSTEGYVGEGAIVSLVVRAEDEAAARLLAHEKSGEDRGHDYRDDPTTECYLGKGCWLDAARTTVVEIPLGAEAVLHLARG